MKMLTSLTHAQVEFAGFEDDVFRRKQKIMIIFLK